MAGQPSSHIDQGRALLVVRSLGAAASPQERSSSGWPATRLAVIGTMGHMGALAGVR